MEAMKAVVPDVVRSILKTLEEKGFEAYLVGGCVRDMLMKRESKDWDIATSATPEKIQAVFPDSVYENEFGTVGVKTESDDSRLKVVEVTTFRIEGKYTDKRHPDQVMFTSRIEDDLSRRDFTMNAIAARLQGEDIFFVDPYAGAEDIKAGIIKTVGDPVERFREDALRLMRAVRFAAELDFQIDLETRRAIVTDAGLLEMIAKERVRDELQKLIMTPRAADGIVLLEELNLLRFVLPELREGLGVGQNKHHIYTVFEHNVRALEYTAKQNYSFLVRLASLLHDVAKPRVKNGDGPDSTFYNHEVVGGKMTITILDRLHFSKDFIERVAHLVRCHLFYYNVGEVTEAGVRRFLLRVGPENIDDLIKVREADRIGSGVPKAVPYKIRHLLFMIEKVKHDPISPKMLKLNGQDVMHIAGISPSPTVGRILAVLLEEVIEDPKRNTGEYLEGRVRALAFLHENELAALERKARGSRQEFEAGIEEEMKKKYYVQ